jgi:hypothetical protein
MTIDLGNQLFAIGAMNRLVLCDRGCHIKTKQHNVLVTWEEISRVFRFGHKQSLSGFTFSQKLGLDFEMKDGRTIQIEFTRLAFLWGVEFLYHNYKSKRLFEILAQHVPIR